MIVHVDNGSFCCGVYEVGRFEEDDWGNATQYDSPEEVLKMIAHEVPKGAMVTVWFKKQVRHGKTFDSQYQYHSLRASVQKIPNVVHIGKTINPNSGNRIDGYAWVNQGVQE